MSLEHIFRNIWDIRIFDTIAFSNSPQTALDIYEIKELLGAPEYESIQIEDSIVHLVREQILTAIVDTDPDPLTQYFLSQSRLTESLIQAVMANSFNAAEESTEK